METEKYPKNTLKISKLISFLSGTIVKCYKKCGLLQRSRFKELRIMSSLTSKEMNALHILAIFA